MLRTLFTACVLAVLAAPAVAGGLVPQVAAGTDALQTWRGRATLCRAYLETQGYPYAYLHRLSGFGLVRTCTTGLYRQHRDEIRRAWARTRASS
jgi:hypothetical protein